MRNVRYADSGPAGPSPIEAIGSDRVRLGPKNDLVEALLACDVIIDQPRRMALLLDFRSEIKTGIDYFPDPRFHTKGIVRRCLNIPGGIEELGELIRGSGEAPEKVARVEAAIQRITGSNE